MSDYLWPHGLHSPWNSPGQNTGVGSLFFSRGSSQPSSPTLQADSSPTELWGKPNECHIYSFFSKAFIIINIWVLQCDKFLPSLFILINSCETLTKSHLEEIKDKFSQLAFMYSSGQALLTTKTTKDWVAEIKKKCVLVLEATMLDPGSDQFGSWWKLSSWFKEVCLLNMPPHSLSISRGWERVHSCWWAERALQCLFP